MIKLTCTHCQSILELDDAFAGGVLRCRHCGTIQTVPRAGTTSKTLYKQKARPESLASSSGLDELATIISSGSGLEHGAPGEKKPAKSRSSMTLWLSIAGTVIVILVVVVIVLLMQRSETPPIATNLTSTPVEVPKPDPNFCGLPISQTTIVYLLDRGDSSRETFAALKNATYKSIESLGPTRRFQILFWHNGEEAGFPLVSGPVLATPENLKAAKQSLDEIAAFGKTDIAPALKRAMAGNPSVVILATGKAWDLDDAFTTNVLELRGNSTTPIHTIALGDPGSSTALKTLAEKTSGKHATLTPAALKAMAD